MDLLTAIEKRVSRRTYVQASIVVEKVQRLQECIAQQNAAWGLTITFMEDGSRAFDSARKSYGMFKNVRSLIVLKGPASDAHLEEKTGYAGEMLVLEATRLALGTCWVGGTFDRQDAGLGIGVGERMTCVLTIGPVADTLATKEKLLRRMTHLRAKPMDTMYDADETPPDWFMAGMRAVSLAPSAVNQRKVRFHYKGRKVTADIPAEGHFLDVDLGIAKCHFALAAGGKFALGNGGAFTKE